mgnify:CR=1 FL=1
MSYKILDVELTKSTLAVKEQFIIRVSIGTWDFVGKNYSWKNLYDLKKWGDWRLISLQKLQYRRISI